MAQARTSPFVLVVFAVFVITTTDWFNEVEASPVDAHPAAAVNRHPSAEAHELDSPRRVARQDDSVANSNAAEDQEPRPASVNGNGNGIRVRRPGATSAPADGRPEAAAGDQNGGPGPLGDILGSLGQRLGQALATVLRRTFRKGGGYGGYYYG